MGRDVFIVHAAVDKRVAWQLADALDAAGVTRFLDKRDQATGVPWDEAIGRELRDSLLQVVLLGTSDRWYQFEEIDLAIKNMRLIGANDRVVPVLLAPRTGDLPYGVNRLQALDWTGASEVAAALAAKVRACRGAGSGGGGAGSRKVKLAVVGVTAELRSTLDNLARRLGQRSDLLDGEVRVVDVADPVPKVDLAVVVLRARHAGKLDVLSALVERSRGESPDVIAGGLSVVDDQVEEAYEDEAPQLVKLKRGLALKEQYEPVLIGHLDDAVARWHTARYPAAPGRTSVRQPWETRYLEDKKKTWREGTPSQRDALDGRKRERSDWFIHLHARRPWREVGGEVRHEMWLRTWPAHESMDRYLAHARSDGSMLQVLLHPSLWWGGRIESPTDAPEQSAAFRNHDQPARSAWLDQVLSHPYLPRCLVVGLAGAGKTVLLEHLATVLESDDGSGDPDNPRHRVDRAGVRGGAPIAPIPVLHRATSVVAHLRGRGGDPRPIREALAQLLISTDTFTDAADVDFVRAGIDAGRYVFLIDGLDEVPSTEDRRALVAALGCLDGAHPRVIVTTRPGAYTDVERPDGFVSVQVAALDEDAAARLAAAWVKAWMPDEDLDRVLSAIDAVRRDFPRRGDDPSPVENPLLLGSLLTVYQDLHRLPHDVATLYREMVRNLCRRRVHLAHDADRDSAADHYQEALRHLFLTAQERGGAGLSLVDARDVVVTRSYATPSTADAWLARLANHTGLIRFEGSGSHAFIRPWHRSYQEYLAAEALVFECVNRPEAGVAKLREARPGKPSSRLMDPVWRDTLRFLIGAALQTRSWGVSLVEALAAAAKAGGPDQARLYRLVAEGLDEYRSELAEQEVFTTLPDDLVRDFEAHGKDWPLEDRLGALDALGRLGDPRLERDKWVTIEAGAARIREEDEWAWVDEFQIMWRPVTVADYRPFVEDSDQARWFAPDDPVEVRQRATPWEWVDQLEHPNWPVVGVSWYEAMAFARWLDAREGGGVALPTELQWVRAARGGGVHEYVWDADDEPAEGDAAQANYAWGEGSVGHPSPVGAFPRGNRGRLVDLAGTVWELCLDAYETGSERVLRGGSWFVGARSVRAAARNAWPPDVRDSDFGFRLARGHQSRQVRSRRSG